jgi:transposase
MAIVDAQGLPIAATVGCASPHETRFVRQTLDERFTTDGPSRLIGDKAYDSDPLDAALADEGIELIAPNRANRRQTQDGRPLRRYRRRWKVERLFAWLSNFRRVVVRYDFYPGVYRAFVHLACLLILWRVEL